MSSLSNPIPVVILNILSQREQRLLVLIVAVRKALGPFQHIKGNLGDLVRSSLSSLVAARTVMERDGVFTLCRSGT